MPISESLLSYLSRCPLLADGRFQTNDLPIERQTYATIYTYAPEPDQTYLDGGTQAEYYFTLGTDGKYPAEELAPIGAHGFSKGVAGWLKNERRAVRPPDLGLDGTAYRLELLSAGVLTAGQGSLARYCMTFKLTYRPSAA